MIERNNFTTHELMKGSSSSEKAGGGKPLCAPGDAIVPIIAQAKRKSSMAPNEANPAARKEFGCVLEIST
jgi:hypothetical protein